MEPTAMIDPITEDDLTAFVDGQLDDLRRLDVESHLARHPETAALVMAELHDRDALREAFAGLPGPRAPSASATRPAAWTAPWPGAGSVTACAARAVIALLVGTGWLAHSDGPFLGVPDTFASPVDPALVADARHAREAAQIRARIASQRAWPAPTITTASRPRPASPCRPCPRTGP